jgi:NAD(P)-dependent dehydrogenase (short-subunit alcohol dehydrogenase family)
MSWSTVLVAPFRAAWSLNRVPLHREGTPENVATAIATLIENDFITGENLVIDGGMTMRIV